MTVNDITALVSTLGFPICMCGAMFWYMIKQNENHAAESKQIRDAISSLEVAITKLTAYITRQGDENE